MTTGMPSGNISIGPGPMADVQVHQPYELRQNGQPWKQDEAVIFRCEPAETSTEDYGAKEERRELPDFLEPTEFRPAPMGEIDPKPKSNRSSNSRPIILPRMQIVLVMEALAPRHDAPIGHLTEQAGYGPGVSYSGTLFQPPTSRVTPLQSYSDEWWQRYSESLPDEPDPSWVARYAGGDAAGASETTDSSVNLPAQAAVEPVPEPAGALAIMAGLPGIAMLWRRKRKSAAG